MPRIPSCITTVDIRSRPELLQELRSQPGAHPERRMASTQVEARASDDGDSFTIVGMAAVFNDLSVNLGGFREKIDRGAFRKVLRKDPDCYCLLNHDGNLILGRTHAGSLSLREDGKGLAYETTPGDTSVARDAREWIDRGEINQSSFGFRVADDSWEEDPETGVLIRTIHEFSELYDVSPCVYPAYPTTDAGLRSLDKFVRGEEVTAEERAEIQSLLDNSSTSDEEVPTEQDPPADGQERGGEAGEPEGHSEAEATETQDGISPVAARSRIHGLTAQI
ncbi:MAG TPA: HK97 family phage prohead protease [Solirubrobacterales bacterium]|nr:HK97 family phage prohead protease [Solirubrobacterales bacterium]